MTLPELRAEHESVTIGPRIWELVFELTRSVSRRYPTSVYNNGGAWTDESVTDLAQEVVLERLPGEAQLQFLFDQAVDLESWRRLLTLQVRRTLSRRRKKTVIDRLLSRVRRLGQKPPFRVETFGAKVWILSDSAEGDFVDLTDAGVSRLASSVRHIPQLVVDPQRSRASMVYRTSDLRDLLRIVVGEIGAVSEGDLARILELLLTSWVPTFLEDTEQMLERDSEITGPVESLEISEMRSVMSTFVARLSEADQQILLSKSQGVSDAEIARSLGRSRPWVAQRKQAVLDRVGSEVMRDFDDGLQMDAMEMLLIVISDSLAGDDDQ